MKLQEIEYAGLKKSDESIEVETICPILDSYSQLQMLLFFAFQHPRWQISLAQFKIFSLLKVVYFFFCLLFTILSLKTLHLMSISRVTLGNELTGWMTVYKDRVRDSTSVYNLVGTQSRASLIKRIHSSLDFSIIVLISLLSSVFHHMGCYSDYLCCSILIVKNNALNSVL